MKNNSQIQAFILSRELASSIDQGTLRHKYHKSYISQQLSLYFSYLSNNLYYQQIRKQYKNLQWLSTNQKRNLLNQSYCNVVKGDLRNNIQEMRNEINTWTHLNRQIIIVGIVIYGKVKIHDKFFQQGNYFYINQDTQIQQVNLQHAFCVLIQKNLFQQYIQYIDEFHFKKKCLKRLFFEKINYDISSKKLDQLIQFLIHKKYNKKCLIIDVNHTQSPSHIFLLISGCFQISNIKNHPLGELSQTYFGQQILFQNHYQYNLELKSNDGQILILDRQVLFIVLGDEQYHQVVGKVEGFFKVRLQARYKIQKSINNVYNKIQKDKKYMKVVKRSESDIKQCQKTLLTIKSTKPKWLIEKQMRQKNQFNHKKNIFCQQSQRHFAKRRRYFSVKLQNKTSDEKFQKQIMKKHLSQQKQQKSSLLKTKASSLTNLQLSSTFSRFSKTTFSHIKPSTQKLPPSHIVSTLCPSESIQYDPHYSKHYDRQLTQSIKKSKHLKLILQLKDKLFPKDKAQLFSFKDGQESKGMTFYQIQKLRKEEAQEKNRRTFQKIFKAKMLINNYATKIPLTFR